MQKGKNPVENKDRDGERDGELGWERKESVRKTGDALFSQDPLVLFGYDIMIMILSRLDARSVARSLLVSRSWHGVASSDRIWENKAYRRAPGDDEVGKIKKYSRGENGEIRIGKDVLKCEELWFGKAHIPRSSQVRGLSKLNAYSCSVVDGKRSRITREDLCDHAWEFHFKEAAPEYWRDLDPYWKGTNPLMRRYFHLDGSLTADPTDEVWGGHECCYTIVTSIVGERNQIREHYVRINKWPRLSVSRNQDWSWEMSNAISSYSSVPEADRDGGTGPLFDFT